MKPFIMPKVDGIRRSGKNRFDVGLSLGSIGSVTDAQALTETTVDQLVAAIKANWLSGHRADGSTVPARREERGVGEGYPALPEKTIVQLENEVLEGKAKAKKPRAPKSQTAKAQAAYAHKLKTWEKRKKTRAKIKKNYAWKRIYKPVYGLPSLNRSGMLTDTLRRDTVRIREKNGVICSKATTRIVVSPKRGGAVAKMRLIQIAATSPVVVEASKTMAEGVKETTTFRSYNDASISADEIMRRFIAWAWRKKIIQKILSNVARAISA